MLRLDQSKNNRKVGCSATRICALVIIVIFLYSTYHYSAVIYNDVGALFPSDEVLGQVSHLVASTVVEKERRNVKLSFSGTSKGADSLWIDLLEEGSNLMSEQGTKLAALEVGMHSATQSIKASKYGFQVHGLEPSPTSYKKIVKSVSGLNKELRDRIKLYNVAAGAAPGVVEFRATGSTGDNAGGDVDMWTMTRNRTKTADTKSHVVKVESMRLDDLFSQNISPDTDIWIAKIDVQGFEPFVFQGLSNSIKNEKIRYIIFEYWPKGMDFMQEIPFDSSEICKAGAKILTDLASAGYKLYAMSDVVHPHSFSHRQTKQKDLSIFPEEVRHKKLSHYQSDKPLDDFNEHCLWYYKLDKIFPQDDYFMGFWTDVLAVAPDAQLNNRFFQDISSRLS